MKFKSIYFLVVFLPFTFNILTLGAARAQSPTPSSIRDSVKQQVDAELSQIKSAVSKRAYLGSITAASDGTLTLSTLSQSTKNVTVAADALIKLKGGKDGTPADLKVGDFILVMGDADSKGSLTAKRVLVISQPAPDKRHAVFGTITKATTASLTLSDIKNQEWTVKLTSESKYTGRTKAADIKSGVKIVAVGTTGATSSQLTAKIIHLVPPSASPTP